MGLYTFSKHVQRTHNFNWFTWTMGEPIKAHAIWRTNDKHHPASERDCSSSISAQLLINYSTYNRWPVSYQQEILACRHTGSFLLLHPIILLLLLLLLLRKGSVTIEERERERGKISTRVRIFISNSSIHNQFEITIIHAARPNYIQIKNVTARKKEFIYISSSERTQEFCVEMENVFGK